VSENNNKLQKKVPDALKEKTQYALAFGVIAMMLFAVGFPMFVIVFFGIFAYFLWKTFTTASPKDVREVFEFYLSANEILRDDERRWFGFEVHEVINRGERILQTMQGAPPLVYFTLGALYNKIGDHKAAINHLTYVVENESSDESTYNYPSPELRNYVKILRKIEREPAEAPQTSAAVRALERARRNRAKTILEESRAAEKELARQEREALAESKRRKAELAAAAIEKPAETVAPPIVEKEIEPAKQPEKTRANIPPTEKVHVRRSITEEPEPAENGHAHKEQNGTNELYNPRKPITEVLQDIYGEK
jgi:hypothetical protein